MYPGATIESADAESTAPSWIWLVDVERACTLLIGRCLGDMFMGIPLTPEEIKCHSWMISALFRNGAEPLACDIGTVIHIYTFILVSCSRHYSSVEAEVFGTLDELTGCTGVS